MLKKIFFSVTMAFLITLTSYGETLFLAHYNGDTSNLGCNADYATGSEVASILSVSAIDDWPSMTTAEKFGNGGKGALDLDWWFGRSLNYNVEGNYNNDEATLEFFVRLDDIFCYDQVTLEYLHHGGSGFGRRYIFNDNLEEDTSGHVDAWVEHDQLDKSSAYIIAHIIGDRNDSGFTITLVSSPISATDRFGHFALQWDASAGKADMFYNGVLVDKYSSSSWTMSVEPSSFSLGMGTEDWNVFNTGAINIDELRISDQRLYDSNILVGEVSFAVPDMEFYVLSEVVSFLAHYDGNTGNNGFDADFAWGATFASTSSGAWPALNVNLKKFGSSALDLAWWSGKSLLYSAPQSYNSNSATVEFQLNSANSFYYDSSSGKYLFDGVRRYLFNDDIAWNTPGHVDMWIDGDAGSETARLVVHIAGSRQGVAFTETLMGPAFSYNWKGGDFAHYAVQWDGIVGRAAVFVDGVLYSYYSGEPWEADQPGVFKIGMQSANVAPLVFDEFRICNRPIYNMNMSLGEISFDPPTAAY